MLSDILGTTNASSTGKKVDTVNTGAIDSQKSAASKQAFDIPENLTPELLALPGMKEALLRKAGILPTSESNAPEHEQALGYPVQQGASHWVQEFEINDYPREARWKVTQKETTSRMQEEFQTAVTMKGSFFPPGKEPGPGERKVYLHLEAASENTLRNAVLEIQRMLNEETLRVSTRSTIGGSHKYNVLG
jgi:ATP-dependent RNA helicase DDX46/PRP5